MVGGGTSLPACENRIMARPLPTGIEKSFLRAPIWLFRARLGFLAGHRLLMVEHVGRRSGATRRTVLEVAGRTDAGEWVVVAGYGPTSDWYRNLRAAEPKALWLGARRHTDVGVRFVGEDEAAELIADYEEKHPRAATLLFDAMGESNDGSAESRKAMMRSIPMVAFEVR